MDQAQTCPGRTMKWLTLIYLATAKLAAAEDQCDGPLLQLLLRNGTDVPPRTLYGVLAAFGGIPSFNLSQPVKLAAAVPLDACSPLQQEEGAIYLVERGNCSFVQKYQAVVAAGGQGLMLFDDIPGCITMGGVVNSSSNGSSSNSSSSPPQPPHRNASDPPAISISHDDGLSLLSELQSGQQLTLQWQLMDVPALDVSALLLWLMAVGTVVAGSLWCGSDYALELKGWGASSNPEDGRGHTSSGGGSSSGGGGMEVLEITMTGAVGFVAVSSAMLLLLYFFLSKVFFYVILAGFAAAGAQALAVMLLPLLTAAVPRLAGRFVSMPFGWGQVGLCEVLVVPAAAATAVLWAVARNASWSWVLQDLLGVAIMLLVLRTLRLPNLRVACVLLPLCFAYDVFWVFLQPLLMGPGSTSVMVEVASGGESHEFLPMLLRVPRLSGPPIIRGSYSLLGFGDVILPGLLVALMRRLDIMVASSSAAGQTSAGVDGSLTRSRGCCRYGGYFVPAVMGYGGGLLLTYVALMFSWFGDEGQPALLYLVPSTLGVVLALAAARGELKALLAAPVDPYEEEADALADIDDADGYDDGDAAGRSLRHARGATAASAGAGSAWHSTERDELVEGGAGYSDMGSGAEQRVALLASMPDRSSSTDGINNSRQQKVPRSGPGPLGEAVEQQQQCQVDSVAPVLEPTQFFQSVCSSSSSNTPKQAAYLAGAVSGRDSRSSGGGGSSSTSRRLNQRGSTAAAAAAAAGQCPQGRADGSSFDVLL